MIDEAEVSAAAAQAAKELRARARAEHGGNTQPLMVVYAVESFLRRLALSDYSGRMVLKGGMLMAASSIRQMTKDTDLSTHGLSNDEGAVRDVVALISGLVPDPHDGVVIDPSTIRTEAMREGDEYQGVRCKLVASLGRARIPFALDFSFGDPDRSVTIDLASVVDRPAVRLNAYPLALNLAEKIVTAMQRRETGTRDRDFGDLWVTSCMHDIDAQELREHILTVAEHREQPIISMAEALANMPDRQQPYAAMVERMSYLSPPPERWTELIDGVIGFVDPVLVYHEHLDRWDHTGSTWAARTA